jgi:hypothetical protein
MDVNNTISENEIIKYFHVQDTTGNCYRDIIATLTKRGWKSLKKKKLSSIEKKMYY